MPDSSTAAQPATKHRFSRQLILLIVIVGIAVGYAGAFWYQQDHERPVRQILDAWVDGDVERVLDLVVSDEQPPDDWEIETLLIEPEERAELTGYAITESTLDSDDFGTVSFRVETIGLNYSSEVRVHRNDWWLPGLGTWQVERFPYPTVRVIAPAHTGGISINDVWASYGNFAGMTLGEAAHFNINLVPGRHTLAVPARGPYVTTPAVTIDLQSRFSPGSSHSADLRYELSPDGEQRVAELILDTYEECLAAELPVPDDCPSIVGSSRDRFPDGAWEVVSPPGFTLHRTSDAPAWMLYTSGESGWMRHTPSDGGEPTDFQIFLTGGEVLLTADDVLTVSID